MSEFSDGKVTHYDDNGRPIWIAFTKRQAILLGIILILTYICLFVLGTVGAYDDGWNDCAKVNNEIVVDANGGEHPK